MLSFAPYPKPVIFGVPTLDFIIPSLICLSIRQHGNIVKLFGIKKTKAHIFLVLEYCAGGDLQKFIRSQGRLSEVYIIALCCNCSPLCRFRLERGPT